MSKQVEVIEVGPRDGFQSVKCTPITTEQKLTVIDQLVAAGVKHIEYTSFVSPKAIPQLADAADVTRVVLEKYPDMDLFALIPNLRGAQNAYELGLRRAITRPTSTAPTSSLWRRTRKSGLPIPTWTSSWIWPPPLAVPLRGNTTIPPPR